MTTAKTEKQTLFEGLENSEGIKDTGDNEKTATTELSRLSDVGLMIGSKWKVAADDMNIMVMRKRQTKDGSIRWDVEGYFATPAGAFDFLVEQNVRDTGLKDLKTVVDTIAELKKDILEALKAVKL